MGHDKKKTSRNLTTGFDVVTLGTATVDVVMHVDALLGAVDKKNTSGALQCFPLGSKLEVESKNMHIGAGGGATNSAVTFARQGLKTACIAEVGQDIFGALIVEDMRKEHIQPFFSVNTALPTAISVILIQDKGERTVFVHRGASSDLSFSEIPFANIQTQWVYCAPGGMPHHIVFKTLAEFHKKGTRIALNPSRQQLKLGLAKLKPLLSIVDVLLVNQEEASYVTKIPYTQEKRIFKTLDKTIRGIAVMTKGPQGLTVSDGKTLWSAGIYKNKKVIDRLGAGDAFGSGFVAGLVHKHKTGDSFSDAAVRHAMKLGSANATAEVEAIGAQTGSLTKKQFETGARWKTLKIEQTKL